MPTTTHLARGKRTRTVYQALRRRIGLMHPGVPLPPVPELMRELAISQATIDKAYGVLEHEGWIERKRGKGIFAADRMATGEIAIVLNEICLSRNASPIFAQTASLLRQKLYAFNSKWAVKLHLGLSSVPGRYRYTTLDLLEATVLPRLRGVLSFQPLHEMETKLAEAGVPVIYMGVDPSQSPGVYLDYNQLVRDGIQHLAEAGCHSVALLNSRYTGKHPSNISRIPVAAATAAEYGLKFQDEWTTHEESGWTERHGYELFMRIWDKPERPDGIMVGDNILCNGVLRAILERQVNLPRDLRLVTHANRGIDFPYPRPVTRLEFNQEDWADKAVKMIEILIKGQPLKNQVARVEAILVKGETT